MGSYWMTKKTLSNEGYKVTFDRYMEDVTDNMCDSLNPTIIRNPDKNRISLTEPGRGVPSYVTEIPASLGNHFYKKFVSGAGHWKQIMDECMLTVCAYHDAYDCYSDYFKDINGVRPHYSPETWSELVDQARSI